MGLKIKDIKVAENRKRIDAEVEVSPFWGDPYRASLRILSRKPLDEGTERSLVRQVIDRKQEWRQGKKNQQLALNGVDANAYILKFENTAEW